MQKTLTLKVTPGFNCFMLEEAHQNASSDANFKVEPDNKQLSLENFAGHTIASSCLQD